MSNADATDDDGPEMVQINLRLSEAFDICRYFTDTYT